MNTQSLRTVFEQLNPRITPEEWRYLERELVPVSLKRKAHFLEEGERQNSIGFLFKGLIRESYLDREGNENTVWFFQENGFVTDYPALLQDIPTRNTFTCLEPCELILIPQRVVLESYDRFPSFERFGRLVAEQVLIQLQNRMENSL
ncbi:MAG: cyclic nucleotide-binding domain-containing protein [Bacteroidota bacterium]